MSIQFTKEDFFFVLGSVCDEIHPKLGYEICKQCGCYRTHKLNYCFKCPGTEFVKTNKWIAFNVLERVKPHVSFTSYLICFSAYFLETKYKIPWGDAYRFMCNPDNNKDLYSWYREYKKKFDI